jgi:hypothetical protein
LKDTGARDLYVRISPPTESSLSPQVLIANIVTADKPHLPIYNHNLSVISEIYLEEVPEPFASAERRNLDTSILQFREVSRGERVTPDLIVHQENFYPPSCGGDKSRFEVTSDFVIFDDEEFDEDISAGPLDRLKERLKRGVPINEKINGISREEAPSRYASEGFRATWIHILWE